MSGYMRFAGSAHIQASSASLYTFNGLTNVVVEAVLALDAYPPSAITAAQSKFNDSLNNREWVMQFHTDGSMRFAMWQSDATSRVFVSTTSLGMTAEAFHEMRISLQGSNQTATFFRDGTQVGSTHQITAWNGTFEDVGAAPARGAASGTGAGVRQQALVGNVQRYTVYTDLARTTKLFELDFTNSVNSDDPGTWSEWRDSNNNLWTMQGTGWEYFSAFDPPNLAVTINGSTAELTWDASPSTPDDYLVFRRTPQTGDPFDPEVDTPVAITANTFHDDTGLDPGDYDWQVFGRTGA